MVCGIVHSGKLTKAIRKINPRRRNWPWAVLCDNEPFLQHDVCLKFYVARSIHLWKLPVQSPDLNPIEMFWARVRRQLCLKDLDVFDKEASPPREDCVYLARDKVVQLYLKLST